MTGKLYLEIITPDKTFFSGEVDMLIYPTSDGERGLMYNHTPMVTPVIPGVIRLKNDDEWIKAVVTEGFLEVSPDMTIMIIDTAEWTEEIDIRRAEEALVRAKERLTVKINETERSRTDAAIARARARLKATKK